MRPGVLFVSPCRKDATTIAQMLGSLSLQIEHVADLAHARARIQKAAYQVVLTEANLPDGTWIDVLDLAHRVNSQTEVIVTDREADARFWAEVLNRGAYDLIAQPFATAEVQRILSNACSRLSSQPKVASAAV